MKVWGSDRPRPEGDLRRYYEPAIEAIAESGIAVEVSTAGLRKPARELYPAQAFLQMCVDAGAPVALSSDAHRPEDVGADYEQALELLAARRRRASCACSSGARDDWSRSAPMARMAHRREWRCERAHGGQARSGARSACDEHPRRASAMTPIASPPVAG